MTALTQCLYIHWPFCTAKCPYCDFNVHLAKAGVDEDAWSQALLEDLARQLDGIDTGPLETIYFGGGTPSLMSAGLVGRLIEGAQRLWPHISEDIAISLEVHPTWTDLAKFDAFYAAGVRRVSIGVQSFDDRTLAFLGRDHGGAEARAAVLAAREVFPSLNLDLMTALPAMSLPEQRAQIDQALALRVDHLSVYQLNIKAGTPFGAALGRGTLHPKPDYEAADFFDDAAAQITAAGMNHYEVSNFAKPGQESRHSLLGWQGVGYLGIGPGAEGRVVKNGIWHHRRTRRSPKAYLSQPLEIDHALPEAERRVEQLIFGLRLSAGLAEDAPAWSLTRPERIAALVQSGDLARTARRLHTTAQGRLRLDAITDYLINHER